MDIPEIVIIRLPFLFDLPKLITMLKLKHYLKVMSRKGKGGKQSKLHIPPGVNIPTGAGLEFDSDGPYPKVMPGLIQELKNNFDGSPSSV